MKTALFVFCLFTFSQVLSVAQTDYACQAADTAEKYLSATRTNLANQIRYLITETTLGDKEVEEILNILDRSKTSLTEAGFGKILDSAVNQIEAAQKQASAALVDPANKEALSFDFDEMLRRIALVKSQNDILQRQLSELRNTIGEVRQWLAVVGKIVSPEEMSVKVKPRLSSLLAGFEKQDGTAPKELRPEKDVKKAPIPEPSTVPQAQASKESPQTNVVADQPQLFYPSEHSIWAILLCNDAEKQIPFLRTPQAAEIFLKKYHNTFENNFNNLCRLDSQHATHDDYAIISFTSESLIHQLSYIQSLFPLRDYNLRRTALENVKNAALQRAPFARERSNLENNRGWAFPRPENVVMNFK